MNAKENELKTSNLISSNKTYLLPLGFVLAVIGSLGIYFGIFKNISSSFIEILLFVIGGAILLISSIFAFYLSNCYIKLCDDCIILKILKPKVIKIEEIKYIEWSWYLSKQGNCYIYHTDGRSVVLQRKLFSSSFYKILPEYAENKGIKQHGLDKSNTNPSV